MARGYLSSGRTPERENNSWNVRIRRNHGSLNDKFLAETATPAEKRLNNKGAASDWPVGTRRRAFRSKR